jgi:ribosomal protein S18 acetylase RimI-like enzyme
MLKIVRANSKTDLGHIRELFNEYAASLNFDLCFQNFDQELAELPGEYAPPPGRLLVALHGAEVAGCVGLRKLSDRICEMKRLYVRPVFRGQGFGRRLALAIIEEAHRAGYEWMRLDTVPSMREAICLYESLGFKRIGAYCHNPICGAIYLELPLTASEAVVE